MVQQTFVFHVINYHDCDGCRKKVHKAVGLDLKTFDLENGYFTVSTNKGSDVVKKALEEKTKKKVDLLSPSVVPNDERAIVVPSPVAIIPYDDVQENRPKRGMSNEISYLNKKAICDDTITTSKAAPSASTPNYVVEQNNGKIIITIEPQQPTVITITHGQAVKTQPGSLGILEVANASNGLKTKHRHHLIFKNTRLSYTCSGCKELGLGARYECERCPHYFLHPACMYYKEKSTHEFFEGSVFKFHQNPFDKKRRVCNACGMDIKGFFYHSENTSKDLHPCCLDLPKAVTVDNDNLRLCKVLPFDCLFCNSKKNRLDYRDKCWCYSSENEDCYFHVYCLKYRLIKCMDASGGGDGSIVVVNRKETALDVLEWTVMIIEAVLSILTGNPFTMIKLGIKMLRK